MSIETPDRDRHESAVAQVLTTAADKIDKDAANRWRLHIDAPRWAIVRGGHEAGLSAWLFLAAFVWGGLGVALVWHLSDQLASNGNSVPPLTEQIGLWAAVVVVLGGAVAAGITAFRSAKLHVTLALDPSAKAEAERRAELHDKLMSALDKGTESAAVAAAAATATVLAPEGNDAGTKGSNGQPSASSASSDASSSTSPGQAAPKIVDPKTTLSPKVAAGTATAVLSAAFWTVAAATFWHKVEPTVLAALGTGLTTVGAAIAAWWKTDPLRIAHIVEAHPKK
jgi:hypothetical protein